MKTTNALWLMIGGATLLLAGCAGDATGEDAESTGDALSRATVGADAVAVEIHTIPMALPTTKDQTVTVALPSKMHRIVTSLKKRAASDAAPRCMPASRTELRFLDATGAETSKATVACGYGELTVNGKTIQIKANDTIDEVAAEPLTVGDALWGITKVKVSKPIQSKSKFETSADGIEDMLDAVDADQKLEGIDPHAPVARCAPSYSVTFKRGNTDAGWLSFNCGDPSSSSIRVTFAIPGGGDASGSEAPIANGRIEIDPRPFVNMFANTQ